MLTLANVKPSARQAGIAGLLMFLSLGLGVEWSLSQYRQEQAIQLKEKAQQQREMLRARIENELNASLVASNCLANFLAVQKEAPPPTEIRDTLSAFFQQSRHVRGFELALGSRIAYSFPQTESNIGSDYRDQPSHWPWIERSINTHAPLLEGPLPSGADGAGLAYRVPLFHNDRYIGLLSAVIDDSSLLAAVGFIRSAGEYEYALQAQNERGESGEMILGTHGLFNDPKAVSTEIPVPGGQWRLAVKPITSPPPLLSPTLLRVVGWLFSGLFALQTAALLKLRHKLSDLALYDPLTGLPKRPLFLDRVKQAIRRAKRNRGNFSVVFIDLDDFNLINVRHGAKVGDMMLAGFGKRLIGSIRHCDTVTRWEGDEFLVLLDACPFDQAQIIAENLRHKIELPVSYGELMLRIGSSIGVATYPEDGRSLKALLKAANARMEENKNRRRKEALDTKNILA